MTKHAGSQPKPLKPGTPPPMSGIYQRPDGEQVVSTQGHRLPPGPRGTSYTPVKPALHIKKQRGG